MNDRGSKVQVFADMEELVDAMGSADIVEHHDLGAASIAIGRTHSGETVAFVTCVTGKGAVIPVSAK